MRQAQGGETAFPTLSRLLFGFALIVAAPSPSRAASNPTSGQAKVFSDSVRSIAADPAARLVRSNLSAHELSAQLPFTIALSMRNFADLEARIARGETIPQAQMEANYLPSAQDYAAITHWLTAEGFTIGQIDPNHTNVFATGTVQLIEVAFGVHFGRVATADGEFTSALDAPTLPAAFAGAVLSVNGLQPHHRMHHQQATADAVTVGSVQYIAPSDLLAAYKNTGNLSGTGQTIAIVMDQNVAVSDLALYDSVSGTTHLAANTTVVPVPNSLSPLPAAGTEAAQDVEWTGGMAPGAKVRLYVVNSLSSASVTAALTTISADASANHITVVSLSFAQAESNQTDALSFSQIYAQMAAAGITVCAGSGDGGSNPSLTNASYSSSASLQPEYPASDPNVLAVGGTTITFAYPAYTYLSEVCWATNLAAGVIPPGSLTGTASSGGISTLFTKPSWQTGGSVLAATTKRCVPDVAAPAAGIVSPQQASGAFLVIVGGQGSIGNGTSLSAPIWAGIAADLNQARANVGLASMGLIQPYLYPLQGTSSFTDITVGNNGAYSAGTGYDLVTGLGTPNIAALATAVAVALPVAPTITSQPQSVTVNTGSSFSLSVTASGTAVLTYQWSLNGTAIGGATSSSYAVSSAAAGNAGSYTVVVSNSAGTATSSAAVVTVNAPAPVTTGGGGGGGGGGAPSWWFYAALAVLLAARKAMQNRQEAGLV